MDSDEDDEPSESTSSSHGPSTSTTSTRSQRTSTSTSSEDESADNGDDHGEGESGPAIQSKRSHDSGRTVLCPDLHVLTNDEHWTVTPEAHKYAAAAGSFCLVTTANGEQQEKYNLTTKLGVQRSLCLEEVTDNSSSTRVELPSGVDNQTRDMLERCMSTCGKAAGARAKMKSRARKEASAQEVRGVFDLVDMRKFKPKNFCDRTMGTHHQDRQNKANSSRRRLDGYCEISKTNGTMTNRPIPLRLQDQDF